MKRLSNFTISVSLFKWSQLSPSPSLFLSLSLSPSLSLNYNYDKDLMSPLSQSLRVDISLSLFISPYFSLPLYACLSVWIFLGKNGTIIQRSFTNICYSIYSKALHHTFFSLPVTLSHSLFQSTYKHGRLLNSFNN